MVETNVNPEPKTLVTFPNTDWNIGKTSRQCSACERQFVEEEPYFSALYDEIQQFTRKDFCLPCWQRLAQKIACPPSFGWGESAYCFGGGKKGNAPADRQAAAFWKTRIPKTNTPPKKCIDTSIILDFFLRLEGNQDPEKKKLRYTLALFLMRKKLLKYKDIVRSHGQELLVLEYPQENKVFEVCNPLLTEEEIATLTSNLIKLFDTEGAEILPGPQ
ncbi:MAG TPA: hypothetical protein ACFYD6_04085 [Candidatus Brocadiia bacterium]|nr:hypothetical protein [Planctomycetota bacterium]MDO8094160.1 hypothetical protein [Candidatus Brocadiales bacterium]